MFRRVLLAQCVVMMMAMVAMIVPTVAFSSSAVSRGAPGSLTQVITDVDDTLKSSGGVKVGSVALGGVDVQYSRGVVYPGVFQFMFELTNFKTEMPMTLAVLTARAEEFKTVLELKPASSLCVKAAEAGAKAGIEGWGVGPVLYGSVAEWIYQANKVRADIHVFE